MSIFLLSLVPRRLLILANAVLAKVLMSQPNPVPQGHLQVPEIDTEMLERSPYRLDSNSEPSRDDIQAQPSDLEPFPELCPPECQECARASGVTLEQVEVEEAEPWVYRGRSTRQRCASAIEPARQRERERRQRQRQRQQSLENANDDARRADQLAENFANHKRWVEEELRRNMEKSRRWQEESRIRIEKARRSHEEFMRSFAELGE